MSVEFVSSGSTSCVAVRSSGIPLSSSFTVGYWQQISTYLDWGDPFHFRGGADYIGLECNAAGRLYLQRRNSVYAESNVWTDSYSGWAYIALRSDGTNLYASYQRQSDNIWVNVTSISGMAGISTFTSAEFGGSLVWAPDVNGTVRLREFRMWGAQLSDGELQSELASVNPVRTSNLLTSNHLTSAASAGDDSSSTNIDWTVTGTPTDNASDPTFGPPPINGASFPTYSSFGTA